VRGSVQTTSIQQGLNIRISTTEVPEKHHCILGATAGKQRLAEMVTILAGQTTILFKPFNRIGIQYFAPDVSVVTG
jgi:hypothetical protein